MSKSTRRRGAVAAAVAEHDGRSSGETRIGVSPSPPRLDEAAVLAAYSRWAPIYDRVFGRVFDAGRKSAVSIINRRQGRLLEVGVGTGIALPHYGAHLEVTGIDLSPAMLAKARRRVAAEKLANVVALHEMDATDLAFPDGSFDTVAVMYTITVVPHPDRVMAEVERVTAPGGEAIIVSHFASESGWRRAIETALTPFTRRLGWRPDFPIERILGRPGFELVECRRLGLFGIFTVARLRRRAS
jgi:phosphatidylethanolamine/phosphatidyl-N-methylethanolamine N-methyltransferase